MVNDKLSYCRFLAMKSLFGDKVNKKSYAILDTANTKISDINTVLKQYGIPIIS